VDAIGVIDTTFARVDMGSVAVAELESCPGYGERFAVARRTVPGFKDLAVACKRLIESEHPLVVVALGMPGRAAIDQVCAHEASQGLMLAQLLTSTHILEVFVHETEEEDPKRLVAVCEDRARKHARNAYWLAYEPDQLAARAGKGVRQGYADAGPLTPAHPGTEGSRREGSNLSSTTSGA
jgi:riboflavin synthase